MRWRLPTAVLAASLVAGCGTSPQQRAHFADVEGARSEADAAVSRALDRVAVGGRVLGRGREDACDPGQHNWKVHTSYALRCRTRAFVLVAPSAPLAGSVNALHDAFAAVGCPLRTLTVAEVETRSATRNAPAHSASCDGTDVMVVPVWERRDAAGLGTANPPAPSGFDISATPLSDAALDAVEDTQPFAWFVETSRQYVDIPQ